MKSNEIRRAFLEYFVERGHLALPGLPLVPNDPSITTLFAIAGMQQMIPYFLGRENAPAPNMTTVQQTIRTNDIDEVGDLTHCTFFEMLGNFSVGSYDGSYFKAGAIQYTWDFLVNVMRVPADRWWAVTYLGDEEARQAWIDVGVPAHRIGETADNWWGPPGPYGPCGPNSEIHFDRGIQYSCGGPACRPETECCDRFVEVWNDVFMSYYQEEDGERHPLPWNNVDTGMGFERLAMVAQGVESMYDTDLYQSVIAAVAPAEGTQYGSDAKVDRSLRIIADHSRAVTFLTAAGVMPSSDGRGYVLRRILRRAALHGRVLGITHPFLTGPVTAVIDQMGEFYRDLDARRAHILDVVQAEERRFLTTLSRGLTIFEELADRAAADGHVIAGEDAFRLYDTHGFPLEMTIELAQERGLVVDEDGFQAALSGQRTRARESAVKGIIGTSPETWVELSKALPPTIFTGYDELRSTAEVVAILAGGQPVNRAEAPAEVQVILDRTPFYAESGGQIGDTGSIRSGDAVVQIADTQRPYAGYIAHHAKLESGALSVGDAVVAEVDTERRLHILPHHSGTHLLHKALQEVLGPEATQAGSLVAPDRLRFDFRWPRAMTAEELREVQDRINAAIWANLPVRVDTLPYDEAISLGAMALFGEKYGNMVRVVNMGNWSRELCGGTHVDATGDIGLLVITGESGIGGGTRRIEALAGASAYAYFNNLRDQLEGAASALDTRPDLILSRAQQVTGQLKEQARTIDALARRLAEREAVALTGASRKNGSVDVVAARINADSMEYVEAVSDAVKSRLASGAVILGTLIGGSPRFTLALTRNLVEQGYNARDLLRSAAEVAGAKAGGRPEYAQGGSSDASKLDMILSAAADLIRQKAEEYVDCIE